MEERFTFPVSRNKIFFLLISYNKIEAEPSFILRPKLRLSFIWTEISATQT